MTDLPKDYEVVIVGTGLTESIISAALSRIGKTVLHIDRESFYGGEFSSHALESLTEWTEKITRKYVKPESKTFEKSKSLLECTNDSSMYYMNIKYQWNEELPQDVKENLLKLSRRFSIDLCPNIFYSRGKFIELLISSDVSKYCEFRLVTQILNFNENYRLEKVPTSRSEIFKTDKLSMIEKRQMMKFIQACMKDNDFQDLIDDSCSKMSFSQFVRGKNLSKSITNYIINAVAMMPNEDQTVKQGLNEIKKFLSSVGRFGDSPFLFSLYGTGELPQCFCRMAAVFGAIYHLNMTIKTFEINSNTGLIEKLNAVTGDNEIEFTCKSLIIDSSYVPLEYFDLDKPIKKISRCILITDRSIFDKRNDENISLLFLPKTSDKVPNTYCIEASHVSQSCPKGYYLIYLFCDQLNVDNPEADFKEFIQLFFTDKEPSQDQPNNPKPDDDSEILSDFNLNHAHPKILFEYYYSHVDSQSRVSESLKNNIPANLFITTSSKAKLDYDDHVLQAKEIFKKICPNQEFLPKPPEQEDIIFDNETEESDLVDEESKLNLLEGAKENTNNDIEQTKEAIETRKESPLSKELVEKKSKKLPENNDDS